MVGEGGSSCGGGRCEGSALCWWMLEPKCCEDCLHWFQSTKEVVEIVSRTTVLSWAGWGRTRVCFDLTQAFTLPVWWNSRANTLPRQGEVEVSGRSFNWR